MHLSLQAIVGFQIPGATGLLAENHNWYRGWGIDFLSLTTVQNCCTVSNVIVKTVHENRAMTP